MEKRYFCQKIRESFLLSTRKDTKGEIKRLPRNEMVDNLAFLVLNGWKRFS